MPHSPEHPVTSFEVSLPSWLRDVAPGLPAELVTAQDRMDLALDLADRNWREGTGGPFGAVVVDSESGQVLSVGVNLVLEAGLSAMHAEVVALSLAQRRLRSWDLGADGARLDLISSARPCLQCLGAVLWSGVRSLAFGADGSEVERITGFDEGPYPTEWETELDRRGIAVADGVRHDRALQVLEEFAASGAVVYNARGHGEVGTGEP